MKRLTSLMFALSIIAAISCSSGDEADLTYASAAPVFQPYIRYSAEVQQGEIRDYVILADDEVDNELVMIELTIFNQSGEAVDLDIDESAAELELADGSKVKPIDPIDRALQPLEQSDPQYTVEGFLPIWGEVTLDHQHELTGYLVFEVPISSEVVILKWSEADKEEITYR